MYSAFFVSSGLRVALAVDGDHGLWKVLTLKPNLVVMDLAMPVVDGWATIRAIKEHATTKHIPVVALTGHAAPEDLARAAAAGADLVLTKPCSPEDLLVVVRSLLRR